MKNILLVTFLLFSLKNFSQSTLFSSCENVSAFNKNSTPDLAVVIYSSEEETIWNAIRLAIAAQKASDTAVVFVLGKATDTYMKEKVLDEKYDIHKISETFLSNGGVIYTCATCAKNRNTDEVQLCTITSIYDLYEIIKRSKKTISF